MVKYIIKRLLLSLLILFGVSVIIYLMVRMLPVDYIDYRFQSQLAQGTVKQEDVDNIKKLYGLWVEFPKDANGVLIPISGFERFWCYVQSYFQGYFNWLGNAIQGDLGMSFKYGEKVEVVISKSMWISFGIAAVAMVLQFLIAIPLGIKSAVNQYGALDYTVTTLVLMGISLPSFFFASLLLSFFALELGWFPYQGMVSADQIFDNGFLKFFDIAHHMVLPMITLVVLSIGGLMRYTRTNMLEVLNADYIRTARAKGCSERTVVYKHAFRNTLIPVVTMLAGILPSLFSGAMITEQVFAIPGIGSKAYEALKMGDVPFIMGYNIFLAILTVIGTLLSDLMYAVVDPRVKITK